MPFGGGGSTNATSTQNVQPWSGQAPFLTQGFNYADSYLKNYTPQYYPGTQIAPLNPAQLIGLSGIVDRAQMGEPITESSQNFASGLQNGSFLNAAPDIGYLAGMGAGTSGPGAGTMNAFTNGMFTGNVNDPYLRGVQSGTAGPGAGTLGLFSSGALGSAQNPYWQNTANAITASTLPAITSQFVANGSMNNPASAYAASQGLASALSPLQEQNYQQALQQAQSAATTQQQLGLGAAQTQGSQYLQGLSNMLQSATGEQQLGLGAAQQAGNQYQQTLNNMTQSLWSSPALQQMVYTDPTMALQAGTAEQQQAQNTINADIQHWNYNQMLPYNQLANYMGTVGGGMYGSNSTMTTPYYNNSLANVLGGTLGMGMLGNTIGGLFGAGSTGGGIGALGGMLMGLLA